MEPGAQLDIGIAPDMAALKPASDRVTGFLAGLGADPETLYTVETVIEEIVTNAIKYGRMDPGQGRIDVRVVAGEGQTDLVIEDDGRAFDPTSIPSPDTRRSLEETPIGGLGLHLVRQLVRGMEYHRVNGRNQLRVWVPRNSCA
jgi:serine/threonine-protein kinase RsbW